MQIPEQFFGVQKQVVHVAGEVVSVMSFIMGNYYHFLTEMLPRLVAPVSATVSSNPQNAAVAPVLYRERRGSAGPVAAALESALSRVLSDSSLCAQRAAPHVWELMAMLGLSAPDPLIYDADQSVQFHFARLHTLQWEQPNKADEAVNDLWSPVLMPRLALDVVRSAFQQCTFTTEPGKQAPVVYITRYAAVCACMDDIAQRRPVALGAERGAAD